MITAAHHLSLRWCLTLICHRLTQAAGLMAADDLAWLAAGAPSAPQSLRKGYWEPLPTKGAVGQASASLDEERRLAEAALKSRGLVRGDVWVVQSR